MKRCVGKLGDCLEVLKTFPDNSVDSLVTDPPAGISFMGKAWDGNKGGRKEWVAWMSGVMSEAIRVLKPGAHGLVWTIPRTSHWTASAIEDAGFEIRDVVTHLFGSGFPKSLDISKAIDKAAGAEREVVGRSNRCTGPSQTKAGPSGWPNAGKLENQGMLTIPSTDAAKQWQGFGTALKPAAEFWILARKPCSEKTVAANVIKWGTGGLNIDGARIAPTSEKDLKDIRSERVTTSKGQFAALTKDDKLDRSDRAHVTGRFPANLVLTCCGNDPHELDCAVRKLNGQSGISKSTAQARYNNPSANMAMSGANTGHILHGHSDFGGASRFFYCAKISAGERKLSDGSKSNHPTVKPLKLMRYLIKLITPPNGLVLDPFMGSGSTGVAALQEGFRFTGVEREKEYFEISKKRLQHVMAERCKNT